MRKIRKMFLCVLIVGVILTSNVLGDYKNVSAASTKHIIIWKMTGNNLQYYKSYGVREYLGSENWENIIGGGKKKRIKISPDAKYYLLDYQKYPMKNYRVSKSKFKQELYDSKCLEENGKKYYWGTACKITIKNGKVVKFVQEYQA